MCYCRQCIVDKNRPVVISTSATLKGNFAWQITRAFHLAGRCVGCDECTRACPAGIDLRLLNLSLAKAAEEQLRLSRRHGSRRRTDRRRLFPARPRGVHPMSELLTKTALRQWIERLLAEGKRVAGPQVVKKDLIQYAWLASADQLTLDGFIRPANSIKEVVFPRHEELYGYRFAGKQIELFPPEPPIKEQIIIGARPCDAAALPTLDRVFNWDTQDEFYNRRRELTTVVTLACREYDAQCFCTSVGLGPAIRAARTSC